MSHDELTQWDHAARSTLASEVGVTAPATDLQLLLDIARDAAHAVNRPAAPVTTFLLGYAAGSGADLQQAAAALRHLAGEWDLGLHRE